MFMKEEGRYRRSLVIARVLGLMEVNKIRRGVDKFSCCCKNSLQKKIEMALSEAFKALLGTVIRKDQRAKTLLYAPQKKMG